LGSIRALQEDYTGNIEWGADIHEQTNLDEGMTLWEQESTEVS